MSDFLEKSNEIFIYNLVINLFDIMKKFVSLRTKILCGFTVTFTIFFGAMFFWFYSFTTKQTYQQLKEDLRIITIASAKQIDVQELMALYQEGKPNSQGRSDDSRFYNQLRWLQERHEINPQVFLYSFVKDTTAQNSSNKEIKIVYLVDVWMDIDSSKSVKFLESDIAPENVINTLTKGTVEFRDFYEDKWGKWISFYAPIRDKSGNIVGGIGADMETMQIQKLQKEIRRQFLVNFGLSYPILLTIIYGLSTLLTRRFETLQNYAQAVGEGNYKADISLDKKFNFRYFDDETIILGKVLEEMTKKIQQREELLNGIFNQVAVGISVSSSDYKFKIVNQTYCYLLGYSEEELLKKSCFEITHPEDIDLTKKYVHEVLNSKIFPPLPLEKRCIDKNGKTKWFETAITVIRDSKENIKYFITVNQNITRRKEAENKLIEAANTDFLTKLWNRAYFINYLETLLAKIHKNPDYIFALLLIDIDNFKTINDSLGHLVGDQFLINISNYLSKCVSKKDVVARVGGDEFAILLTSIKTVEDVISVVNRIQEEISFPFYLHNQEFITSASIGVVISNNLGENNAYVTASDLFRDADIAMYKVKNKEKNNYRIFGREMYENFIKKLKLENELKKAIEENKLTLFYQPIINLKTGKLSSLESLVRWNHPELGFLSPDKFLPLAEKSLLIVDLGNWVLKTACYQLHQWQEEKLLNPEITVNVNIAGKQFETGDLFHQIINTLEETNLCPSNLRIEVTETVITNSTCQIVNILHKIKDSGVNIAIDDFGTGYSSLARLRNFPVNQIKIDRAFIKPLNTHRKNIKFLQGIINLCHNLDLQVVCEGIETEEQKQILIDLDCNYGQGFFCGKPMSVSDFESWICEL